MDRATLTRELTADGHVSVHAKLDAAGAERLGDVVLDLDPEALATWIANPDARRPVRRPLRVATRSSLVPG